MVTGPVSSAPPLFSVRSSRRVFDGAVTAVRIDEVVMPDGQTASREVVELRIGRQGSGGARPF